MLKTKSILTITLLSALLFIVGMVFAVNTQAQETTGNGLKISPTRIEMEVERGQADKTSFQLENITDLPVTTKFVINDFVADDEGSGSPRIILNEESDLAAAYSIRNFITLPDGYDLAPRQTVDVPITVQIPEGTNPGSYFGVVRAAAVNNPEETGGTEIGLSASVGTILIVTVPGDTVELLSLKDISAHIDDGGASSFFGSAPNNVQISLINEGNIITKPFGRVSVTDWGGEEVYAYELNDFEPRGNVLPGSFRTFTDKIYNVGSFGHYKVQANISYGSTGGSIIVAETDFWVIPWQTILITIGATIAALLFFAYGIKAYNRRIVDRSKGEFHKTK